MTIITNDPFDSIGYGVEWLKTLGLTSDQLLTSPVKDATTDFKGDVIVVRREAGKPVVIAVFNEKYPARDAIGFVLRTQLGRLDR